MALDFSKLTSVVKSVADLAASHASLHAIVDDAKSYAQAVEAKAFAKVESLVADVEARAQAEIDSIVASIEAALGSVSPVTHAEAAGLAAVATALAEPTSVSPTGPAAAEPVAPASVPPVAVGLMSRAPQTVDELNAMIAAGLYKP